jgi:hypothetical protein
MTIIMTNSHCIFSQAFSKQNKIVHQTADRFKNYILWGHIFETPFMMTNPERDQEVDDAEQYLGNHHKFDSPSASRRMGGGHDEVQVDPKNFFDILRLK